MPSSAGNDPSDPSIQASGPNPRTNPETNPGTTDVSSQLPAGRTSAWKWGVCFMLLGATMLNYMDRLTLNQLSPRILADLALDETHYGAVESVFAYAFACGAILGGLLVDRFNVWWVYPLAVLGWSIAGASTGLAEDYETLWYSRLCLGLFEAIHWPCALRTTQRILSMEQRTLGNGILQSGAAIGAVLTPFVVLLFLYLTDSWQPTFFVIGSLGIFWVILWLLVVRPADLALPRSTPAASTSGNAAGQYLLELLEILRDYRFWLLILVVACINITWHYFRAWLPLFLQTRSYTERETQFFSAAYYLAADVGSISVGFAALALSKRGMGVQLSRTIVFTFCAALTANSLLVVQLERGPLLIAMLLIIAFGSLGMFPVYYTLTQDITVKHQGKLVGILGCVNWLIMARLHKWVGEDIVRTQSYERGLTLAGLTPLIAVVALWLFWPRSQSSANGPK